jgi:hypothetical protein
MEALEFRIEAYQKRLKDEVSDMRNDCYFL